MTARSASPRNAPLAPFIALGAFLAVAFGGILVPVYTDEIGWRFQERAAIDGVDIMFNDMCGPNTLANAPWFMMPVRMFSAVANQTLASPLFIRIEGLLCALAWTALLWLLTSRIESNGAARTRLRTLLFSLLSLGMLPFIMVMSRPEQPLILMLTLAMLTVFAKPARIAGARLAAIKAATIVLLAAIAMSYHLKGVVYSPVFFACMAICATGRGAGWPRIAGTAALTALTAGSATYWVHRIQCPGDPVLAAQYASHNAAAVLSNGGSLLTLAAQMIKGAIPSNYVWLALPIPQPSWLPQGLFQPQVTLVFAFGMYVLWGVAILWALAELAHYLWRERLRALAEPRALIAIALLGCLGAWGASQLYRSFYETGHYLPMAAVFCAMCLSLPGQGLRLRERVVDQAAKLGLPLALMSAAVILATTLGPLAAATRYAGWIPGLSVSVSSFGYPQVRRDIAAAMDRAGMGGEQRFDRLLVDDVTYMALQHHTRPLHWLGVLYDWRGGIKDPIAYLVSRNSGGVVMGCRHLPERMRLAASRSGEVCAISRAGLSRLAADGPFLFDPKSEQN